MSRKYLVLIVSTLVIIGLAFSVIIFNTTDLSEKNLFVGSMIKKSALVPPVNGETLTSFSKVTHNGIDIAAKVNTPVKACSDGWITEIKNEEGLYGVTVVIDHCNGLFSYYTGLNENVTVKIDQKIKTGDVIGTVGTTNIIENNLASHLHFAMKENGSWIDPLTFFNFGSDGKDEIIKVREK